MDLVGSTASFKDCPKHQKKVLDLLGLWQKKDYYSSSYVDKLREAANNAASGEQAAPSRIEDTEEAVGAKSVKDAPYVMPASHGDNSTPWFDLPAANLMPHIVPNSTKALNTDGIRPLQLVAGPADETLVVAVKTLLDDVQAMFEEADIIGKEGWDIDELGQMVELDEITGEVIAGETYYGWSRKFCENVKRRKKGLDLPDRGDARLRDSRSRSRSSSRSIRKRRYSDSSEESNRNRNARQRRRSHTSSRSHTPERKGRAQSRDRATDRKSSRRRSLTPQRNENRHTATSDNYPPQIQGRPFPPFVPPPPPGPNSQAHVPYQQGFNPNIPPPPLPPSLPYNNGFSTAGFNGSPFNGQSQPFWPPPPPPSTLR